MNVGDVKNIQKLPFDLHKSSLFRRSMISLSKNLTYLIYGGYVASLGLAAVNGLYLFTVATVSMIAVEQLYQHRWFPSFLESPYFLLGTCLYSCFFFGFNSPFAIAFSALSTVVVLWDYVQTPLCQRQ